MCGIIGIVGKAPVVDRLVDGLKHLEYRGYDSAGIATLEPANGHQIQRRRAEGKLSNLAAILAQQPLDGITGIAHTRWATHGVPNEKNAHPHATNKVAIVHNGIIENFQELRQELSKKGHVFTSDTDTEVVAHLVSQAIDDGLSPEDAVKQSLKRLEGAFALAFIFADHPDLVICARKGSPLAVGYGDGETYLASDAIGLSALTSRLSYFEEGDWAVLRPDSIIIYDQNDKKVNRPIVQSAYTGAMVGKGNYRHYMLKEIYEQPSVVGDTLQLYCNPLSRTVHLPDCPYDLAKIGRLSIVACGTAFYAGWVAKYWFEQWARIPVEIDIASEFRYRTPPLQKDGMVVFISQSGETLDTLAALRYAKEHDQATVGIVNVPESTIARECSYLMRTLAGPEIGVASTKAFTTQLTTLACLALAMARARGTLSVEDEQRIVKGLTELPGMMAEFLQTIEAFQPLSKNIAEARDVLYLGRGLSYPIALEGALKLKEISYIHAEGYAAGEMKHGPIALIDETVPVVVLAPRDQWFEKTASNLQEVIARGGKVIMVSDEEAIKPIEDKIWASIPMPKCDPWLSPILYALPVQVMAYQVAVAKGTDVDQPRNLAKSVTVE